MKAINQILKWVVEYWGALAIIGGAFWSFITAIWIAFVLPLIDTHIDNRVYKMAGDSLGLMIDSHLTSKGGGFRGGFSELTGIPKEFVIDSLAYLYLNELDKDKVLYEGKKAMQYQKGLNDLILDELFQQTNYGGVNYYLRSTGDFLFKDSLGLLWDANYNGACDCFYYYPPYTDTRLKCK